MSCWDHLTLENSTKMGIEPQPKTVNFYPKNMFDNLKTDNNNNKELSDKDKFDELVATICGKDNQSSVDLANGYFSVLSFNKETNSVEIVPYFVEYYNKLVLSIFDL